MSKPEWGIKRVCPSCSIKYYDFNKNPIICPKCEFEFDPDLLLKSRKGRSIATKTEDNQVSSNFKKEKETLEQDINSIENNEGTQFKNHIWYRICVKDSKILIVSFVFSYKLKAKIIGEAYSNKIDEITSSLSII